MRIENIGPHKLFLGDSSEVLKEIEGVHSVVTDPPYHLTSIVKRFGKEGSSPAKHGTDGAFARASKGFMGKCYHPDTEMLTSTGWHKVGDIAVGSSIATLNPDTRELVWQDVSQVHCYPFAGDMVHVKHRSAEQVITPNHKMVVSHDGGKSLSLIQPHELKRTFHLFAQAKPQKGRTDRVTIQSERLYGSADIETREECEEFDPVAFFRFLGLWLGDGFVFCRKNDHPANDFFGVSVKKPRKVEAVRNAIESLGIRFTETQTENGMVTFYCYNFALLGWLKPLGKAKDKHIPSWLFEWDSTILEYLYQGLIDTDGCKQGKDQEVFFTSSVSLANDFQILCLLTGRSCSITMRPGGKEVVIAGNPTISSDAWVCCVLKPGKRMYGEKSESSSNVVYSYPYEGDVVCVGVNEHHIVYTRFNGKPVWSGNSWDGGDIAFRPEFWELVGNAMLPGAHLLAFSGSRTYHRMAVGIDDAGFEIRDQIMWLYGCLSPDTECLTREGWKSYLEVTTATDVMQWDHETRTLSWVKPSKVHEYDFDGELINLKNRNTDQLLTPNHRVYAKVRRHSRHEEPTSYEVVEANDLYNRSSSWQVDLPLAGILDHGETVDPKYAYIMGWWLTDAWKHGDGKAVMFSQSKPATLEKLRKALEPFNPSEYTKVPRKDTHNTEHTFYVTGEIADRLKNDAPDRKLDWKVLDWDKSARQALYEGLMDGDGSRQAGQYAHAFWSKDQERRDVFMALALSLGYCVYDYPSKHCVHVNVERDTTQLQHKHRASKVQYTGKVWCLTVPTGAFVVRRNGKAFITGNSGFPKSLDISKAIDKSKGAEREVVGSAKNFGRTKIANGKNAFGDYEGSWNITIPSSVEAKQWEGWGTSLKPSFEPLVVARKDSVEDENISSVLLELEAKAWLLSLVFNVDKASTLNHPDLNVALNIARWDVAKFTSLQEDLFEVTDTSQLKLKANTFWNTVSSWKTTWEEVLKRGNTFITEMKSNQTIDLKILKSCLSMIMPESIIKDATIQDGQIVFVKNVEKYSNAAMLKLNGILELSALENAISREVIDSQAVDEKVKHEPICMARKPLIGTNAENVLEHGTGAINIDGCRVRDGTESGKIKPDYLPNHKNRVFGNGMGVGNWENVSGRWPANIIHDGSDEVLAGFPNAKGAVSNGKKAGTGYGEGFGEQTQVAGYADSGSAARFFYCAKASRSDRNYGMEDPGPQLKHGDTLRKVENAELKGNIHPTVKPNDLMRYLCRLVTPPNGIVLDPFMGSGSTGIAAIQEGFRFIGIERDPEYFDIAVKRIREAYEESKKDNLLGDLF